MLLYDRDVGQSQSRQTMTFNNIYFVCFFSEKVLDRFLCLDAKIQPLSSEDLTPDYENSK